MKTINFILITLYLISNITSCKSQEEGTIEIINFNKNNTLKISPEKGTRYFPISYKVEDDTILITLNNDSKKQLITYNLSTGKIIETISINFFKHQNILTFNYHNRDSIFLAFNPSLHSRNHFHDSSVMMINNKGEIKKIMNFKNTPVRTSYNKMLPSEYSMYLPSIFTDIFNSNNKLFLSISKLYSKPGDSISESIKVPYGGHYDLVKDKMIIYSKLNKFPFFKTGRYYYRLYRKAFLTLSSKNNPIYSFRHTPLLYEYDYKNNIIHKHRIKSVLVDTILPNKEYKKTMDDIYNAQYNTMYYDKYKKQYYRFVTLAAKKNDIPFRKNNRKISMIVADLNFKVIAEGILPDNISYFPLVISKEGLWFKNSSDKENITLDLYNISYKKGLKQDLLDEYNKKTDIDNKFGISPFMNDIFNIREKDAAIVIVPTDLGCHSCASTISKFYIDNQNLFKGKKLYFIIAGLAKFTVDPFLKQNNIELKMPNLYIDKNGQYLNYFEKDCLF